MIGEGTKDQVEQQTSAQHADPLFKLHDRIQKIGKIPGLSDLGKQLSLQNKSIKGFRLADVGQIISHEFEEVNKLSSSEQVIPPQLHKPLIETNQRLMNIRTVYLQLGTLCEYSLQD